jgi:hypothetical protein
VTGTDQGSVRVDSGSPSFECFVAEQNTATAPGGLVIVNGGSPSFYGSVIRENVTESSCLSLMGGTPDLTSVSVVQNETAKAVLVQTAASIFDCSIDSNSEVGMYFYAASPSMVGSSTISSNGAGGIVLEANSTTFDDCDIVLNQGAGVEITNLGFYGSAGPEGSSEGPSTTTETTFIGCRIAGNVNTTSSGGGVRFDCGNAPSGTFAPLYQDCVITGNASLFSGGGVAVCGIALFTDIAPVFDNCTISSNSAGEDGGGMIINVDASPSNYVYHGDVSMDRTIMWGNCASGSGNDAFTTPDNFVTFDCSNLDSTAIDGTGNVLFLSTQVFEDPGFCLPAECTPSGTADGDFTIETNSPVNPENSPCGQLIGAGDPLCSPTTGIDGDTPAPATTALVANVPNPFNPTTTIRFDVAQPGHVSLIIYDVQGRRVRALVDERLDAAAHQRLWDGTDDRGHAVATGVYFARLAVGATVDVRKMVLIK